MNFLVLAVASAVSACSIAAPSATSAYFSNATIFSDAYRSTLVPSNDPFDLAIDIGVEPWATSEGPFHKAFDFFGVASPDGRAFFTRYGAFHLDADRRMVHTPSGFPIEPPVVLPPDVVDVQIREDGVILIKRHGQAVFEELAVLRVARFPNPSGLAPVGYDLFARSELSGAPIVRRPATEGAGRVISQALETL